MGEAFLLRRDPLIKCPVFRNKRYFVFNAFFHLIIPSGILTHTSGFIFLCAFALPVGTGGKHKLM